MAIQIKHRSPSIHGYTFEAIHKGQYTKKVIDSFSHLENIPNGPFSSGTTRIGAYDYSVKLNQWKITDLSGTLDQIEKDNTNLLNKHNIRILKNAVNAIVLTVCEAEFLPFNYIILHFELNQENLELNDSYRQISTLLNPLLDYWLPFEGRFSSEYKISFSVPTFYQIHYDNEKIKLELNEIMQNLQTYSETINVEKYVENCNKLKQYFLFENLNSVPISMLKIQDNFYFLGTFLQSGADFATVFSLEPSTFQYTGTNPFFTNNLFFEMFPALFFPYLLLVSPIFWLRASNHKITKYLLQLNQLKIEYKTKDYLNSDHNAEFLEIFDLDNNLNFLLSELKELQTMNKIFNNHFVTNSEIIDKSIILEKYDKKNEKGFENRMKHTYIDTCNLTFQTNFQEIKKYVNEIQEDLSFIKKRIEFLQTKKNEKTKSNQNKILRISSIISAIFAVIVGIDVVYRWFKP